MSPEAVEPDEDDAPLWMVVASYFAMGFVLIERLVALPRRPRRGIMVHKSEAGRGDNNTQ